MSQGISSSRTAEASPPEPSGARSDNTELLRKAISFKFNAALSHCSPFLSSSQGLLDNNNGPLQKCRPCTQVFSVTVGINVSK